MSLASGSIDLKGLKNAHDDAEQKATNYIAYDSNGLMVADMTNGQQTPTTATGRNVLVESTGVNIRDGQINLQRVGDVNNAVGTFIYDGQGNTNNNIVANFTNNGSVIGKDAKTIIGSNRILMQNEEGVGLFEAAGTGQSISQRVSEYYGIMLTHTMTLDYTIFTKGIPPQGTEFNIEYDYGGPSPKQPAFTVGVWKSFDHENPNINTVEIVYDGAQTISINYEQLIPYWVSAEIVGLSYTITSDAPAFTLGNRALDSTKGAYSLAVGNNIVASENYQTVLGKYNVEKANTTLIIGNGTDDNNRVNILEVDNSGRLTIAGHNSPIGTVIDSYLETAKNATSGTWVEICHITLDPGVWLITCGVRWPSNSTGYRRLNISETSADNTVNLSVVPVNGTVTQTRMSRVFNLTTQKTYYLNATHNAGTTLSMPAGGAESINFMRATRIA